MNTKEPHFYSLVLVVASSFASFILRIKEIDESKKDSKTICQFSCVVLCCLCLLCYATLLSIETKDQKQMLYLPSSIELVVYKHYMLYYNKKQLFEYRNKSKLSAISFCLIGYVSWLALGIACRTCRINARLVVILSIGYVGRAHGSWLLRTPT